MPIRKNYADEVPPEPYLDEYEGFNFAQLSHVPAGGQPLDIFTGPGGSDARTFTRCNLMNVEIHPAWTVVECNTSIVWVDAIDTDDDQEVELLDGTLYVTELPHRIVFGNHLVALPEPIVETDETDRREKT